MTLTESPLIASIIETPIDRKDLTAAFNAIRNKRKDLDTLFNYYNGPQPLKYSTDKLAELFQNINAHFETNWCSVVVNAVLDRLELEGFQVTGNGAAGVMLTDLFTRLHIDIEADDAHEASLATSQAYIIVWKNEGKTVTYYNDPRLCHVFYEDANPRKKSYAAKWFNRNDGVQEITLYYVDRLEHWVSAKMKEHQTAEKAEAFTLESKETNTYSVIPVFPLFSPGEIFKVITSQDAINKLFADMMTAAEFSALKQKWIISNADVTSLKNSSNEIWGIPAGDGQGQPTSVGQFDATPLDNFSNEMNALASDLFSQTSTPKHYLMPAGANISGEALLAMEAPLTKKVSKRQKRFGAQWQDIAAFIAQLEGMAIEPADIQPIWKRVESIQPFTEAQTRQIDVATGIPLITTLKRDGWKKTEIDAMVNDQKAQDKARQTMAQAVLNDLRIKQQQEGNINARA